MVMLDRKWADLPEQVNRELVRAYLAGRLGCTATINERPYHYDFSAMEQRNVSSGRTRDLRFFEERPRSRERSHDRGAADPGRPASIRLRVVRGRGLASTDLVGDQEPYCIVKLGSQVQQTGVASSGGGDSVWTGAAGAVHLQYRGEDVLHIEIWDAGRLARDDYVGECCVNIPVLAQEGRYEGPLTVFRGGALHAGLLEVQMECSGVPQEPTALKLLQASPARMHRSRLAGLAQGLTAFTKPAAFICYSVALQGVYKIFKDVVNGNPDKKHARIWEDSPAGLGVRAVLRCEHKALYKGSVRPGGNDLLVRTGADFLSMIHHGVHGASSERQVYTYCILDQGLFFSETSGAFLKDLHSKHAVHANAEPKVRFAGTFRICVRPEGSHVLVFDDDSGTYRPRAQDLALVAKLFNTNFPDLEVLGLSILEPQPEETKSFVGPNEMRGKPGSVYPGTWVWRSGTSARLSP